MVEKSKFILVPFLIVSNLNFIKMKYLFGLVSLFVLVVAFTYSPTTTNAGGLAVGDTAPDFSLKNVQGEMVSLSDYENVKGYIVTFSCNTCPYAVMYEDRFIELHNKYADKGWPVVYINPNDPAVKSGDSYEAMQVRAEEKSFPFHYLFDEGQEVFPAYGATKTPHVYLLNDARQVKYIGALDDSPRDASSVEQRYVEDAIAAIESGKNPDPNFTKAIGCSIKTQ